MSVEEPTNLVVDASVILTILLDSREHVDDLAFRLASANLLAPAILPFEVSNVLRRRRNAGLLTATQADEAFATFTDITIDIWPWQAIANRTWALGHNLSTYDAAYVAVALGTDSLLLTCDARIARAPGMPARVEVV